MRRGVTETGRTREAMLRALARAAGLRLIRPADLRLTRRRCGTGFTYLDAEGRVIRERALRERLRRLAVPPAYTDVRFAEWDEAHLQAVGRDAAGRSQYRYHDDWDRVREGLKRRRLAEVVGALPRLRRCIARDLARTGIGRRRVCAAAAALVDRCGLRVGHEAYRRDDGGRGTATLEKGDLRSTGATITYGFPGKGNRMVRGSLVAPDVAPVVATLKRLPGRRLFRYRTRDGRLATLHAGQVNAYLADAAGLTVTAKDLRFVLASSLAVELLHGQPPAESERGRAIEVNAAMRVIAARLANTPAVVRTSYVHHTVIDAFVDGSLRAHWEAAAATAYRRRAEAVLLALAGR